MGNLPCCNPEEPHKPGALFTSSSSSNNDIHQQGIGQDGKSSYLNGNPISSGGFSQFDGLGADEGGSNARNNTTNTTNANTMALDRNQMGLEERQKALYQEKERLERIVNDASLTMVHVNGSSIRGMNAYYDAGYAADVWQKLLPSSAGGAKGGGLVGKCGTVVPVSVNHTIKFNHSSATSSSSSNTTTSDLEKQLSKTFQWDSIIDRKHIVTLNDILAKEKKQHPTEKESNMRSSATEEKTEILLDDLMERFMSDILSQQAGRQFEGVDPIMEHVL